MNTLFITIPSRQKLREAKKGIPLMYGRELNERSTQSLKRYVKRMRFSYLLDGEVLHSSKVKSNSRAKFNPIRDAWLNAKNRD